MEAIQLLKQHFGYDQFRPLQEDIINTVLKGKDSLVLMPTGGGKSLCYQIPALIFDGLTLVISPLISLMKDQVDSLKANGIQAEYINSTLSRSQTQDIIQRVKQGSVKLLYIAPERLAVENFVLFLLQLKVSLIAIDEAHCISEWGHDFRLDYRKLSKFKQMFPGVPILAVTATATPKVKDDIVKQLSLDNPKVFVSSFDRNNLTLLVRQKKDTFPKIQELIKKHEGESAIIYCFSRKDTEKIAMQLKDVGVKALPYHAGLSAEVRRRNQEAFSKDRVDVIVATIAFGMGIDKPDVRLIVHHTFSKSMEAYYQEIGRAGRDGLPADCVLFFSKGDIRKHAFFIDKIPDPARQDAEFMKMRRMLNYCDDLGCRRKNVLAYFGETFENKCTGCDNCLGIADVLTGPKFTLKPKRQSEALFQLLRNLRTKLAKARDVPPYMIFGDKSLKEMARLMPQTEADFLRINGVGRTKLTTFGQSFLQLIKEHTARDPSLRPQKKEFQQRLYGRTSSYSSWTEEDDRDLQRLFHRRKTVNEISKLMHRSPGAIRSRLRLKNLF